MFLGPWRKDLLLACCASYAPNLSTALDADALIIPAALPGWQPVASILTFAH